MVALYFATWPPEPRGAEPVHGNHGAAADHGHKETPIVEGYVIHGEHEVDDIGRGHVEVIDRKRRSLQKIFLGGLNAFGQSCGPARKPDDLEIRSGQVPRSFELRRVRTIAVKRRYTREPVGRRSSHLRKVNG